MIRWVMWSFNVGVAQLAASLLQLKMFFALLPAVFAGVSITFSAALS